jgi:hypothetical protein
MQKEFEFEKIITEKAALRNRVGSPGISQNVKRAKMSNASRRRGALPGNQRVA